MCTQAFSVWLGAPGLSGQFIDVQEPVRVSWDHFSDSAAAVGLAGTALQYEVCVGTTPFGCQLAPFAPAANGVWRGSA